jgi:hypothetical protein
MHVEKQIDANAASDERIAEKAMQTTRGVKVCVITVFKYYALTVKLMHAHASDTLQCTLLL